MTPYPVVFEMDYIERRSSLTTFFRLLLAIPHFVVLYLYAIGAYIVAIIAWFVLLFTASWPSGLYDFMVGYLRYYGRLMGYACLGVDAYPPFTGEDRRDYPVRISIAPPLPSYSRLKVFFRFLYVIPAYIIVTVLGIALELACLASWIVIVVTARQPKGLQDAIEFCLSYTIRATALFLLVTETYPPLSQQLLPPQQPATA